MNKRDNFSENSIQNPRDSHYPDTEALKPIPEIPAQGFKASSCTMAARGSLSLILVMKISTTHHANPRTNTSMNIRDNFSENSIQNHTKCTRARAKHQVHARARSTTRAAPRAQHPAPRARSTPHPAAGQLGRWVRRSSTDDTMPRGRPRKALSSDPIERAALCVLRRPVAA